MRFTQNSARAALSGADTAAGSAAASASNHAAAVCDDDDKRVVNEALGTMADVVVVPCGSKPRNLPFLALHDAVSKFASKAYVAFSESDLTWRFGSSEAADAAAK